jgi:hypothetical protein
MACGRRGRRSCPHSRQKFSFGSFAVPQLGHSRADGAPAGAAGGAAATAAAAGEAISLPAAGVAAAALVVLVVLAMTALVSAGAASAPGAAVCAVTGATSRGGALTTVVRLRQSRKPSAASRARPTAMAGSHGKPPAWGAAPSGAGGCPGGGADPTSEGPTGEGVASATPVCTPGGTGPVTAGAGATSVPGGIGTSTVPTGEGSNAVAVACAAGLAAGIADAAECGTGADAAAAISRAASMMLPGRGVGSGRWLRLKRGKRPPLWSEVWSPGGLGPEVIIASWQYRV